MKNKKLTLGSLFDGSGGFPLAGILSGIEPVWASEIEPFPVRVTTKRIPQMKHYGDISKLKGSSLEPVDIITFGSPCQDLSVAGKRAGIQDGERSNLFFQAIRIIKEMREATDGRYPKYCVFENVTGAYSSNQGRDFKAVLEAVIGVKEEGVQVPPPEKGKWPKADVYLGDGWSVAYRTFDAQYWGVPQRRARIYLVGDFGGGCAGKILFKSEGLCGYSAEGVRAWQKAAWHIEGGAGEAGRVCLNDQGGDRMDVTEEVACTLRAEAHHPPVVMNAAGFCTEHSAKSRSVGYDEEVSPTLRAGVVPAAVYENHASDARYTGPLDVAPTVTRQYGTGGNNQPLVVKPEQKAYGISSYCSHAMLSDNPDSGIYEAETSRTLDLNGGNPGANQGGIAIVEKVYPVKGNGQRPSHKGDGWTDSDTTYTLNATESHGVAAPVYHASKNSHLTHFTDDGVADTLVASEYKEPPVVSAEPHYIVRRLTPLECGRLQGFPDDWCSGLGTDDPSEEEIAFWKEVFEDHRRVITHASRPKTEKQIRKWLKDPYQDGAAYRMWGNGICLNNAWYILSAIVYQDAQEDGPQDGPQDTQQVAQ